MVRNLKILQWAGLVGDSRGSTLSVCGIAADESAIPAGLRRRMGKLERLALRCALGVLNDRRLANEPIGELIFCSRYGNVETLETLLLSLCNSQPVSPTAFSGSVHNAVPGLVAQILEEKLSHTAIAGGARSFAAGLVESAARLIAEPGATVTLIFSESALPVLFQELSEETPRDIAIALQLCLDGDDDVASAIRVKDGMDGVCELLGALEKGTSHLAAGHFS
jgi:hypothetical protein